MSLTKYINIGICNDYIKNSSNAKNIELEQIPNLILFMLNKKKLVKIFIKYYEHHVLKALENLSTN